MPKSAQTSQECLAGSGVLGNGDITFLAAQAYLVCILELNHWAKLSSFSRNGIVKFLSIPTSAMKELSISEELMTIC